MDAGQRQGQRSRIGDGERVQAVTDSRIGVSGKESALNDLDVFTPPIAISSGKPVHLRVEIDYERLHFAYRVEGVDDDWRWLPQQFDASILPDETTAPGQPSTNTVSKTEIR